MAPLLPDDPLMQPDPMDDDDPEVVDSCAPQAWMTDVSWRSLDMPAPRSWQDAVRRQRASREAPVGLSRLARAVQPPLDGLDRRSAVGSVLDIDLTTVEPGGHRLDSAVVGVAPPRFPDPAVNDAFAPLRPRHAELTGLNPLGERWLSSLPERSRPSLTAQRHPHIINKLAVLWMHPKAVETYMSELLVSSRSTRRGFAEDVLQELFGLQCLLSDGDPSR